MPQRRRAGSVVAVADLLVQGHEIVGQPGPQLGAVAGQIASGDVDAPHLLVALPLGLGQLPTHVSLLTTQLGLLGLRLLQRLHHLELGVLEHPDPPGEVLHLVDHR